METEARETVIESLRRLSGYYQSRYEHYLAMATQAKENSERVKLLMLDLSKDISEVEDRGQECNKLDADRDSETEIVSASIEVNKLYQLEASSESESVVSKTQGEDKVKSSQFHQLKQLLQNLSQGMSAIEFASKLDSGKSLHRSYLHQILNRELSQELSVEMVNLYLDEAVNRGLIESDKFDNQCYIAKSGNIIAQNGSAKSNGHNTKLEIQQVSKLFTSQKEQTGKNKQEYLTTTKKHRNLPPSPQLKPTLLETVEQYIYEYNPDRFRAENIINYLYLVEQQAKWSRNEVRKVRVSITNVLSRKAYLNKYWKRIEPGIYQPLQDW